MPKIKQSCIDEIRAKIPIEQVIGDYVSLKKSGSIYKGLSPFSNEKTPSFTVNPEKQFYYCFSTSQGGDVFKFIQTIENLNFAEAIEFLGKKYGIAIEYDNNGRDAAVQSAKRQLLQMHEIAAEWFAGQFFADTPQAQAVRKYWVEERQMSLDDARELRIGYAPENSSELKKLIFGKGFALNIIADSSIFMAKEGERNPANFYPKFRGRLMIPICDIQGQVVGFTGRKTQFTPETPAESGKYVNSRETEIFKKSNIVFNINKAKPHIKQKGYCVMVEGQIDAIKMYSAGIKNTVATQGTALTDNHLSQIKRFCDKAVLLYDGDAAGIKADIKAISMCIKHDIEPMVVPLPDGDDPDSFIKAYGAEKMRELVENGKKTAVSFAVEKLAEAQRELTPQKKGEIESNIFQMLQSCTSAVILNEYLRQLASSLRVSLTSVLQDWTAFSEGKIAPQKREIQKADEDGGGEPDSHLISSATADTLYLVLHYPQTAAPISQAIDPDWLNEKKLSCQILKKLIGLYSEGVEFDASRVDEFFDSPREQNAIYKILANPKFLIENPTKYANDCIKTIYKNYIDREIRDTTAKLADASVDAQDKVVLLKKVVDLKKMSLKVPNQIEEK